MVHACIYLAIALVIQVAYADKTTHEVAWNTGVTPFAGDAGNTVHVQDEDILKFVSDAGSHDVAKFLDKFHYTACNFSGMESVHATQVGPFQANVTVANVTSSTDMRMDYYGCSTYGHCTGGMKLQVMAHRRGTLPASMGGMHGNMNETAPSPPPLSGASQEVPFFGVFGLALVGLVSALLSM